MGIFRSIFGKQVKEEIHAKHFVENAFDYIKANKTKLPNKPVIIRAINQKEFDYWAMLVALRAADSGAIIKYGIDNPLTKRLLNIMIKKFQRINKYVSQNLQYNQIFIQEMRENEQHEKEIKTVQEINGTWLLYSLEQETFDHTDAENLEAAKIIGEWLFEKYTRYWDNIPNYE
jgi:hypothetical protein